MHSPRRMPGLSCVFKVILLLLVLLLACACKLVDGQGTSLTSLNGVAVKEVQPKVVNQLVQTNVHVTLNTSLCGQLSEEAIDGAQLVLQRVTADGGSLTFTSNSTHARPTGAASGAGSGSSSSSDGISCSSFDFPILLGDSSRHGNVTARLLLPKARLSLQLQEPLVVAVPWLLSVVTRTLNVTADQSPFAVGVRLNHPAPAEGISVRLQLSEQHIAKVQPDTLFWRPGSLGRQDFRLRLQSVPSSGVLTASLVKPTGGALLQPGADTVGVVVQSPVVSFRRNLGYYRGLNSSSPPKLFFTLTGSSAFPVEFAFTTFLLPGSRPSLRPCHPLMPSCSVADQEAVDNVTITATRYITPGQHAIVPVEVPISWGRLPPEAELRVGLRVISLSNCRVAPQVGEVAAIIFGTPPGHCPPGSVLAPGVGGSDPNSSTSGGSSSSSRDRPIYTHVAALQELALVLGPGNNSSNVASSSGSLDSSNHRRLLLTNTGVSSSSGASKSSNITTTSSRNTSSNKTTSSSSSSGSIGKADFKRHGPSSAAPVAAAIVSSSNNSSSRDAGSVRTTVDLDPPFRPLVDRYMALLPPGPSGGQLMLSSSRQGDVVVVDTTACGGLDSVRYSVTWAPRQHMWREFYPLAGQSSPCWIRVHVFSQLSDGNTLAASDNTNDDASAAAAAAGDAGSDAIDGASGSADAAASSEVVEVSSQQVPRATNSSPASQPAARPGPQRRPLQQPASSSSGGSSGSNNSGSSSSLNLTAADSELTNSTTSSPSVWDLPSEFALYRTYTIRFIPLRPPEQLSLHSITFGNNVTTVIACGVPLALSHLFVVPRPQQGLPASQAVARPSSIMSSNFQAATATKLNGGRDGRTSNSSIDRQQQAPVSANASAAVNATGQQQQSRFVPLASENDVTNVHASASADDSSSRTSSSRDGNVPVKPLLAAPGVDVQVAYLVIKPPGTGSGSSTTPGAGTKVAEAPLPPSRLRQQQFSVFDKVTNRTVIWSKFTSSACAQDRYILLPLAQLKPDMKMVPELTDPEGLGAGVNIAMSAAAVAFSGSPSGSNSSSTDSTGSSGPSSGPASAVGVPGDAASSPSSWVLGKKALGTNQLAAAAANAAVDGGREGGGMGQENLVDGAGCTAGVGSSGASNRGAAPAAGEQGGAGTNNSSVDTGSSSSSSGGGGGGGCLELPGLTAEMPIILTADEGRSSKTYTLLLYSNATAAAAVKDLILPQEAAAAGTSQAAGSSGSSSQAADAAALSAAYFAARPQEWPKSPAQSNGCSICPNGTYSTRTDGLECKVCPPGKYAASPFSTGCLYCPPGTFSYYWGAPLCRTCLPGTYAAAAGSLFCDICRDGTTTRSEGATQCEVTVAEGSSSLDDAIGAADVALLLSFGLLLDGTSLESVSRSLTGINGSSEGIVGVLVRGDTASALNISLGNVQVVAVQQIGSRQLLVNVSAALPVSAQEAAAASQDLSADPLIQRLIDDPNTFLRTTQTLGAESASVQDVMASMAQRSRLRRFSQLHTILWPSLAGTLLLLAGLLLWLWRWRQHRRRLMQLAYMTGTGGPSSAAGAAGGGGLLGLLCGRGTRQRGSAPNTLSREGAQAPAGPGWFYGDSFMTQAATAATSNAAADPYSNSGRRSGVAILWQQWQRLLSSNVRFVLRVRGHGGSSRSSSSGGSSASRSSSPVGSPDIAGSGPSGCSPEGGLADEYRVDVVIDGQGNAVHQSNGGSSHQHDFCLREESFAARLRTKHLGKQQQ